MVAMEFVHITFGMASAGLGWALGGYLSEIWYVHSLRNRRTVWYLSLIILVRPVVARSQRVCYRLR